MWPLIPQTRQNSILDGPNNEDNPDSSDPKVDRVTDGETEGFQTLEFQKDGTPVDPPFPLRIHRFQVNYVTTHKSAALTSIFSPDGRYVATGSADTSIKLLDVPKMHTQSRDKTHSGVSNLLESDRPVRTFYDHTAPIADLAFHPTQTILASCSRDCTVRLFDYSKTAARRSFRAFHDVHPCRSLVFHPGGDHILLATDDVEPRLIDLKTQQFYTMLESSHRNMYSPLNDIAVSPEGRVFAVAGMDGQVQIYDTSSNTLVREFKEGCEITSVNFSRNGQYVLYSARDFKTRLYDWSSGKLLRMYSGAAFSPSFNYNESLLFSSDEFGSNVVIHNARTSEVISRTHSGHNGPMRKVATSPIEPVFMTCSDDHRARFWVGS